MVPAFRVQQRVQHVFESVVEKHCRKRGRIAHGPGSLSLDGDDVGGQVIDYEFVYDEIGVAGQEKLAVDERGRRVVGDGQVEVVFAQVQAVPIDDFGVHRFAIGEVLDSYINGAYCGVGVFLKYRQEIDKSVDLVDFLGG